MLLILRDDVKIWNPKSQWNNKQKENKNKNVLIKNT